MSAAQVALLAGLLLAPAVLLWLGHHMQRRTRLQRGAFWGGMIGHTLFILPMLVASIFPPVGWEGGGTLRTFLVYWSLPSGALAGAAVGVALARRRTRPPRRGAGLPGA